MPILRGIKFLFFFLFRKTLSASFRLENLTMILFFLSEGSGWHDSRQPWFTFIPVTFPIYPHTFLSLVESEIPKIFTNSRREYCSFLQNCFSKLVMHFSWVLFIASEISNSAYRRFQRRLILALLCLIFQVQLYLGTWWSKPN